MTGLTPSMIRSLQLHLLLPLLSVPVVYSQCNYSASCTFQNGFCGFSDGSTDDFSNTWLATDSMYPVPEHDGRFVYPLQGALGQNGTSVDMTSPSLCSGQPLCASYDYVITSVATTLQVLTLCDVGQRERTLVDYSNVSSTWQTDNITVAMCTNSSTKVVFRGPASVMPRLAMDNIDIRPCNQSSAATDSAAES